MHLYSLPFRIGIQVKMMVDAVKDVKEAAFFLKKEKPYWWDLSGTAEEIKDLVKDLKDAIKEQGSTRASTTIKGVKDEIAHFTEGGITTVSSSIVLR